MSSRREELQEQLPAPNVCKELVILGAVWLPSKPEQ